MNIYLTTSKLAAYIVLIVGTFYAYMYQDSTALIATFSATSAILMLKTYTARDEHRHRGNREMNNETYNQSNNQQDDGIG